MCSAPLPQNCEIQHSSEGILLFRDTMHNVITVEHPLFSRFETTLERERLDLLVIKSMRSLRALLPSEDVYGQADARVQMSPICQDCLLSVSTKSCLSCSQSFCDFCYDLLHSYSPTRSHHPAIPTPAGSRCAGLECVDVPTVWCKDCANLLCMKCFVTSHSGSLDKHNSLYLEYSAGNSLQIKRSCSRCTSSTAHVHCDSCNKTFCGDCFREVHKAASRIANHTASVRIIRPVCMHCRQVRATIYCEECSELICSQCFGTIHGRGNRYFHRFTDASNILLLIEKLDAQFQKEIRYRRKKILINIVSIQAHIRGFIGRRRIQRMHFLATRIQKVWRGHRTRSDRTLRARKMESRKAEPDTSSTKRSFTSRLRSLSRARTSS